MVDSVIPAMTSRSAFLVTAFETAALRPLPGQRLVNATPTLQVLADGNPAPFSVQFQVNIRPDFSGVMVQATQLDGQVMGMVQLQVTSATPPSVPIYWRCRSGGPIHIGDAPTWGPWCATQWFVFALEDTTGGEYLTNNVGITLPPWSESLEVMTENVGVGFPAIFFETLEELTENVGVENTGNGEAHEELTVNVGFIVTDNREGGEYLTESEVSVNMPPPHIWFAWRPVGFAGDHVYLYGQGFGDAQRDHHVRVLVDNGPDYTAADIGLTVFTIELDVASLHAYDATRRINAGTLITDPFSDPEVGIIEVVIPAEMAPAPGSPAVHEYLYVITDGGTSNRIDWLMYPTLPTALTPIGSTISGGAGVRVTADPTDPGGIPQRHARFEVGYVVENGLPQRPALLSTTSRTSASLGTGTGSQALEGAHSAVTGASARWLADPATLVARPDLGTGVSLWVPSQGAGANWRLTAGTAPYVDPGYLDNTRNGPVIRDALILDGSSWMELDTAVGTSYGFLVVANLHPGLVAGTAPIITSFADGAAPAGTEPIELYLDGSVVSLYCAIAFPQAARPVVSMVGKTVMIGLSVTPTFATLTVVDEVLTTTIVHHATLHPSSRFWLGRDYRVGADQRRASIDIMDLAWWNAEVTQEAMQNAINALDSVYGVLRR